MKIEATKTTLKEILSLRNLFLQESNFQIRYNASHERGRTDSYKISVDTIIIGYGSLKGNENPAERNTIFEFYIIPSFRHLSSGAFAKLLNISSASFIECQSNDILLNSMLYEYGQNINANVVLFKDQIATFHHLDDVKFRKRNDGDVIFEHKLEPEGDYVLEKNNQIVATGGFLLHYNVPFADLYMEVRQDYRRQGLGSFLLQEVKKQCYLATRVPAARCDIENIASRATLQKAGMAVAGFLLLGTVKV
jgi:GNAT superfamily N-acetyltransferase